MSIQSCETYMLESNVTVNFYAEVSNSTVEYSTHNGQVIGSNPI